MGSTDPGYIAFCVLLFSFLGGLFLYACINGKTADEKKKKKFSVEQFEYRPPSDNI